MKLKENAGIILGHSICLIILIISFIGRDSLFVTKTQEEAIEKKMVSIITTAPISSEEVITSEETPAITPTSVPIATPTIIPTPTTEVVIPPNPPEPTNTPKQQVLKNIEQGVYATLGNSLENWWFIRKLNQVPSGSGEAFDISEYGGMYRNKQVQSEDKVIYLTLDCGYGNLYTKQLLDIFKKYDVKVTFFVTNYYLEVSEAEVKRMVEEGHKVANHSATHAKLPTCTEEKMYQEIVGCEEAFYEITGQEMAKFFRPPEGSYSKKTMQITKDLGYKTVFWSIAYKDYDINNQPGKEYVLDHFKTYHHNGAIVLMHNDSKSNLEAMEEVLLFLIGEGYRFGTLDEIP